MSPENGSIPIQGDSGVLVFGRNPAKEYYKVEVGLTPPATPHRRCGPRVIYFNPGETGSHAVSLGPPGEGSDPRVEIRVWMSRDGQEEFQRVGVEQTGSYPEDAQDRADTTFRAGNGLHLNVRWGPREKAGR